MYFLQSIVFSYEQTFLIINICIQKTIGKLLQYFMPHISSACSKALLYSILRGIEIRIRFLFNTKLIHPSCKFQIKGCYLAQKQV